MNELQIAKEVFLSILKWVLVIILLNNLIWAFVIHSMMNDNEMTTVQKQDGHNNIQELRNG